MKNLKSEDKVLYVLVKYSIIGCLLGLIYLAGMGSAVITLWFFPTFNFNLTTSVFYGIYCVLLSLISDYIYNKINVE